MKQVKMTVNNGAIKARREAMAMTMDEAATRAGWSSRTYWYKVEAGRNPSAIALYRVAKVLGCPMEALIATQANKSNRR